MLCDETVHFFGGSVDEVDGNPVLVRLLFEVGKATLDELQILTGVDVENTVFNLSGKGGHEIFEVGVEIE